MHGVAGLLTQFAHLRGLGGVVGVATALSLPCLLLIVVGVETASTTTTIVVACVPASTAIISAATVRRSTTPCLMLAGRGIGRDSSGFAHLVAEIPVGGTFFKRV